MRAFVPRIGIGVVVTSLVLMSTAPARAGGRSAAWSGGRPRRARCSTATVSAATARRSGSGARFPIALDTLNVSDVRADAKVWETVVRKMRAGLMPPAGQAASRSGQPRCLPRLARRRARSRGRSATRIPAAPSRSIGSTARQYQNAIRDLLNLEIDVTSLLPSDDSSYGFDNIAGVLKMSPTLMERYLSAAQKISRAAVGTPPPTPTVDYFRVADDLAQDRRLPGQSFGTRGGTKIRYTFPMDAQYVIRVQLSRDLNEGVPVYAEDQQLEVSVDGERVKVFTLPGVAAPGCGGRRRAAAGLRHARSTDGDAPKPRRPRAGEPRRTSRKWAGVRPREHAGGPRRRHG